MFYDVPSYQFISYTWLIQFNVVGKITEQVNAIVPSTLCKMTIKSKIFITN